MSPMANAAIFFEGQPVKLPVDLEDATLAKCFAEYLTKGKASSFGGKMKPGGGVIVDFSKVVAIVFGQMPHQHAEAVSQFWTLDGTRLEFPVGDDVGKAFHTWLTENKPRAFSAEFGKEYLLVIDLSKIKAIEYGALTQVINPKP